MGQKLKVLVAGLHKHDNNFTRRVTELGCEPLFSDGDPGKNFPTDADVVIFLTTYLSHSKYYAIKGYYKKAGKQIFEARGGWSSIEQRFMAYLADHQPTPVTQENKDNVINISASYQPNQNQEHEERMLKMDTKLSARLPSEVRARVQKIVEDCYKADMSIKETADMLNAEGLTTANGRPFDISAVNQYRVGVRRKLKTSNIANEGVRVDQTSKMDIVELIAKVNSSKMSSEAKVRTIERILAGEIKDDVVVEATIASNSNGIPILSLVRRTITSEQPKSRLTLTPSQAEMVIECGEEILKFVQGA